MALLFFFFSIALTMDIYNLVVRVIGFATGKDLTSIMIAPLPSFYIALFLAFLLRIYGYLEAKALKVKKLTVHTSKLPEGIDKLTIAHISDLHLGIMVNDEVLDKVIREINTLKPDLIVSTGDLLDEGVTHIDHFADKLKLVQARFGKFAVIGNHEFFGGLKHSLKFIKDAGFTVLRGEGITVQNTINIAGIDDPLGSNRNNSNTAKHEKEILSQLPSDKFTLFLKHRPNIDKNALGLFDLQLSGHTHGGQSFPMNLAIIPFFHYKAGYKSLSHGSAIYVSHGAGTVCMPVRFLAPPEITIIEVSSNNAHTIKMEKYRM